MVESVVEGMAFRLSVTTLWASERSKLPAGCFDGEGATIENCPGKHACWESTNTQICAVP